MSNLSEFKQACLANGFHWNLAVEEFISEYGGKKIVYSDPTKGSNRTANLGDLTYLDTGAKSYEDFSRFLGESVIPVGDCHARHIELLLTESGKLMGFADGIWLRWGLAEELWVTAVKRLLAGEEPIIFAKPD